jgi:hypothetical protein
LLGASYLAGCSALGESAIIIRGQKKRAHEPYGFSIDNGRRRKIHRVFCCSFSKLLLGFRDSGFTDAQSSRTECRSVHASCAGLLVATNADIKKQITCSEH